MRETMSYPQLLRQGFDFLGLIIKVKAFACFAVDIESLIAIYQILIVLHRYLPKDGDRKFISDQRACSLISVTKVTQFNQNHEFGGSLGIRMEDRFVRLIRHAFFVSINIIAHTFQSVHKLMIAVH